MRSYEIQAQIYVAYGVTGLFLLAGITYLVLGFLVKRFPLPCTILGLILFVSVQIIGAVINPVNIVSGWLLKIVFLVSFISAIKAAKAYENDSPQVETAI